MRRIATLSILLGLALCASSCARPSPPAWENVYTPLSERYRVPIPVSRGMGGQIREYPRGVGFSDDFGSLFRIERLPLSDEQMQKVEEQGRKQYLETFLIDRYIALLVLKVVPSSTITHREWKPDFQGGAFYVQMLIPGGSTTESSTNGGAWKREDVERSFFVFVNGQDVFIISTTLNAIKNSGESKENRAKRIRSALLKNTLDFAKTITFASGKPPAGK